LARCSLCGSRAVAYVRYARLYLCAEHFRSFFIERVRRIIERYRLIEPRHRVLAAVSGGKDSSAMVFALKQLSQSMGFELLALHIDLGIGEYSRRLRGAVEKLLSTLSVPTIVLDLRSALGLGVAELARRARRSICSVCGTVKRYVMNVAASLMHANSVATGHNADDVLAYVLKALVVGGGEEYARKLVPRTEALPGAVSRIRPLYEVYERETLILCISSGLPYEHSPCPYAPRESIEREIKRFLSRVEELAPGTKIRLVRRIARGELLPPVERGLEESGVGRCSRCGFIARGDVCSFCRITERVLGEAGGPRIVEYLDRELRRLGLG